MSGSGVVSAVTGASPGAPPGPPPGELPPGPRRRPVFRLLFLALGIVVAITGIVLLLAAASPGTLGLSASSRVPLTSSLLGIVFLLWAALLLARASRVGRRGRGSGRFDPALRAARERYARGEITREQFFQIAADLRHRPPGPLP